MVSISGPVTLKVFQEGGPVGNQAMDLEVSEREREAVIDPDERRDGLLEALRQTLGQSTPGPISSRARLRCDLLGFPCTVDPIDAQALEARRWRLGSGVIDTDIAIKGVHESAQNTPSVRSPIFGNRSQCATGCDDRELSACANSPSQRLKVASCDLKALRDLTRFLRTPLHVL